MRKKDKGLADAIQNAGSAGKLAKGLKIKVQAVSQWERCPPGRVLEVERITGVSRHDLRPDFYPREQVA
jgi:DNA-binding transcriptional regulator YdaS (Cro superfamily)